MEVQRLERNLEALNAAANDQEPWLRDLESKALNIALGYVIRETCFFFAVSRTYSSHRCVPWWMVLGLSLSGTAVYLLLFLNNVTMLFRTLNALNIILREQTVIWHRMLEARNEEGYGFEPNYRFQVRELHYGAFRIVEKKVYIAAIVCTLVIATALEVCACKYSVSLCE